MDMDMNTPTKAPSNSHKITGLVRQRIEKGGERLWQLKDFQDLSFAAVAQALSRLKRAGMIERVSKGIYYHSRQTALGKSHPNPAEIQKLVSGKRVFPSGIAASNLLGFTTQNANKLEISTNGLSLPRQLVGHHAIIHTRRPEAWSNLEENDAALLDFLRDGGMTSELSPKETIHRTLRLLAEDGRFERLLKVSAFEPPRVKAMLGALGEQLGKNPALLRRLRASLNPFSKFDFGLFADLKTAGKWQAKARR
jgi:DNA-binding HxlR family transcriptional regulator